MTKGMKILRCGGCGGSELQVYRPIEPNGSLSIECIQCKSITILKIKMPQIILEWGHASSGILTTFSSDPVINEKI